MIFQIIIMILSCGFCAAVGYFWGTADQQEEADASYMDAFDDVVIIFRSSLVRLNARIKELEDENDMLRERIAEEEE